MIRLIQLAAQLERWTPTPLKLGLARLCGWLAYLLSPRIRHHTIANMSVVLGLPESHPKVRRLAARSVIEYAEHTVDFLRSYRLSPAELLHLTTEIDGHDDFRAFHEMRRGGIMITGHFGNWEWCGGLVSLDHPTYVVAETFRSRAMTALLDDIRARKSLRSIQLGGAARGILRVLRRGEYVALLADRPTPGKGVEVTFFGRPVWVPEGSAALALRAGSPLLVGAVIRRPDRTYSAYAMPPIVVDPDKPKAQAIAEAMQSVMSDLETLIRKAPAQWYMFRSMWADVAESVGSQS